MIVMIGTVTVTIGTMIVMIGTVTVTTVMIDTATTPSCMWAAFLHAPVHRMLSTSSADMEGIEGLLPNLGVHGGRVPLVEIGVCTPELIEDFGHSLGKKLLPILYNDV